jgi:hypothetical protein
MLGLGLAKMKLPLWFIGLKYLHHPATLYHVGDDEFHVVFNAQNVEDDLREAIEVLNARRVRVPWQNYRVLQFGIAGEGRWAEEDSDVG